MNTYNKEQAERVWKRVRGEEVPAPSDDIPGLLLLIAEEWEDATTYLQLSRQFSGKESGVLRKMFQQEQAHTACLKGIYTLMTGSHPTVRTAPPSKESPELVLRKCYGREMRCLAAYEERAKDPQYGQVFARLADQEREHCRMILELLGSMKRK